MFQGPWRRLPRPRGPSRHPDSVQLPNGAALALFGVIALAALLAQVALLRSAFAPPADVAPDRVVPVRSSRFAELAWAVLPALTLAGTFAWGWTLMRPATP